MGLNGSDVAKQSADIVLTDDNFSTIIRALRKGRSVINNLSKVGSIYDTVHLNADQPASFCSICSRATAPKSWSCLLV